jgi:hypothetical protein
MKNGGLGSTREAWGGFSKVGGQRGKEVREKVREENEGREDNFLKELILPVLRSEERRVGKDCLTKGISRWTSYHY